MVLLEGGVQTAKERARVLEELVMGWMAECESRGRLVHRSKEEWRVND